MMRNPEITIGNLIDKQKTAYIGSIDSDGFPNIKAMFAPRKREGIRCFYFTTNISSVRAEQYSKNSNACIYFCDKRFYRGVMLKGKMEIHTDMKHRKMIWQDGDTMYYPQGMTDPDYCVLKFIAHIGRYYSSFKSEDFEIPENTEE